MSTEKIGPVAESPHIPTIIAGCSPESLQVMSATIAPEPMPEDMRQAIQSSLKVDRAKLITDVLIKGYRMSKRGDIALASVAIGAATNHWEIALAGYSYWMYFRAWSERLEAELDS
jgi:hypothetical protein